MKMARKLYFLIAGALALALFVSPVEAGDTLMRIKSRERVRCGVSDGVPGFSFKDPDGHWSGMDVDFCRALAAAVPGDPGKVEFIPLSASAGFPSLKAGEIDVLVQNATWTVEREATLEVMFAGVLYYDGQSLLVPVKSGVKELSGLNGATVCAVKGTTHVVNLTDYFQAQNWTVQPLIVESQAEAGDALFAGRCGAFTSERSQLATVKLAAPGGPQEYLILPDQVSKEPMGPVVRRGDDEWFTIVRGVLMALIGAEEAGVSRSTVRTGLESETGPVVQRWLDMDRIISKALTIPPGWAQRALESVGNYGEMFERNFGSQSPLKLDRGLNRLWTQGGLMYAPPFR